MATHFSVVRNILRESMNFLTCLGIFFVHLRKFLSHLRKFLRIVIGFCQSWSVRRPKPAAPKLGRARPPPALGKCMEKFSAPPPTVIAFRRSSPPIPARNQSPPSPFIGHVLTHPSPATQRLPCLCKFGCPSVPRSNSMNQIGAGAKIWRQFIR